MGSISTKSNGGEVYLQRLESMEERNLSYVDVTSPLMFGVLNNSQVWMSHGDTISDLPEGFNIIASTKDVKVAAYKIQDETTYAIQFHPEVYHSTDGKQLLQNFLSRYSIVNKIGHLLLL